MCAVIETGSAPNATQAMVELMTQMASKFLRAYWECSDELQQVAREMIEIVESPESDGDERALALHTLREILFPERPDAGVPLEEVDGLAVENQPDGRQALAGLRAEEESFADRLNARIRDKGWTQAQLAERVGVTQSAISLLLKRHCRPQQRTVRKLADALDCRVEDLWPRH